MDILDKYQLKDWWLTTLTKEQREQIAKDYQPLGVCNNVPFLYQDAGHTSPDEGFAKLSLIQVLSCIALTPAKTILIDKLEQEASYEYENSDKNFIDLHLTLGFLIKHHYRLRAEPYHYERAKELCLMQINIAKQAAKKFRYPKKPKELKQLYKITGKKHPYYDEPQILPSHTGYKQLIIILEKEGEIKGALKLAKQALKQGWTDDYEKRIDKLNRKIAKKLAVKAKLIR
ncbi:hypothetical protein [Shewanella fidelis]|uniref:Uncharacterized protein n=1 Tax=Shewanella fidelis TaxID=173509 RepID=A0AAW8NFH6_9GAMM|nr:hypothetical protein [Shewanella fidelis]MDR8522104.1 hypothetical protein [Shewanella fidelis]MDW4814118.1 hypothetical protein [Shewanella fidelis]MDW4818283.1 hypothetical protein [Shewanella fidelis]MDW4822407.1 hypothetical protein [Shewanella fidelis]MDW4826539.1 hypothetical protein [Shewanella fidelis]